MGDRIVILDDGKLQQFDTPMECYHRPNNEFVAGFIGEPSMNFVSLTRDGDTLTREGFDYKLTEDMVASIGSKTDVTLGVRPEDIDVVPEPEVRNDFAATVDVIEPFGKEHNLYVFPENADFEEPIIVTLSGRRRFDEGDRIGVRFAPDSVHLFDGEQGDALRHPPNDDDEIPSSVN